MVFLERLRTSLTLGVLLKDELSPDKDTIGEVFLEASGIRKAVIRNSNTGHFLLMDLPEGRHIITGGGEYYKTENLTVDYIQGELVINSKPFDSKPPVVDLFLNPKSSYPFPDGLIVLVGRVVDPDYAPIAGALIKVKTRSATSEENGGFFIQFGSSDGGKSITVTIKKEGYSTVSKQVSLKKDTPTRIGTVILTKS